MERGINHFVYKDWILLHNQMLQGGNMKVRIESNWDEMVLSEVTLSPDSFGIEVDMPEETYKWIKKTIDGYWHIQEMLDDYVKEKDNE
jgi:hypothetical protein